MILSLCPNPAIDSLARINSIQPGAVNRILSEQLFPGGKGVHVAMAAAELGERSELLGFWAGPNGQWIQARLRELGVGCGGVEVPGFTRTCYAFQSSGAFHETELLGPGPELASQHAQEFVKVFLPLLRQAKVVVCSGSLPRGAPENFYADLTQEARNSSCPVILDSSGAAFTLGLKAQPWGVHLNQQEALALTGESDPAAVLASFPAGIHCVALTAGSAGLFLRFAGEKYHANVRIEPTASAVGSGDCLTAGLAVACARGLGAEDTARLAVACGAANCLRAELGMLHRHDVERLRPQVALRRLGGVA